MITALQQVGVLFGGDRSHLYRSCAAAPYCAGLEGKIGAFVETELTKLGDRQRGADGDGREYWGPANV